MSVKPRDSRIASCCSRRGRAAWWRSFPSTSNDPGASTHPRCRALPAPSRTDFVRRCAVMLETHAPAPGQLQEELAGLDALELADRVAKSRGRRLWSATWPKLAAVIIALGLWQLVVWSGWRPEYVLPGPVTVF